MTTTSAPTPAETRERPVASLAEVLAAIRAHEAEIRALGATALYVFGSAARDELRPDSDVDVFVDYERDGSFTFDTMCKLERVLALALARDVDLTTRQGLHRLLRDDIEASSVRVI